ncbi:uncharacterized protein LOC133714369 isoform X8 [Rosa rugosa]|uniref:uncharacterized protein LOC133714369 isoform X8 n=1 Tax=Rosa rugosa TaxID=74645 RepID=UPI002B408F47|nr:uncharacterized protein LOC133714369 isoform X8 [Rosa rugosa]
MHITSKSRWSPTSRTRLMLACGFWCIPTLILSMVQIDKLSLSWPTYLFPEGTDSVIGLTAMMCDYYSMLDYAHVARAVVVHKFCHVGSFAFIGGGSVIAQDVPKYIMVAGKELSIWRVYDVMDSQWQSSQGTIMAPP